VTSSEDPDSTPTRKAPGRVTSCSGAEDTLPWSPRSLVGGASDGTTLEEGSVVYIVFPARLRWHSSMMDCTSLLGVAADEIEDGPPPNSTSPSSASSSGACVITLVVVAVAVADAALDVAVALSLGLDLELDLFIML
jgi:hypothetical protein